MAEETNKLNEEYYQGNIGKKVGDFCIGFFGSIIICVLYYIFFFMILGFLALYTYALIIFIIIALGIPIFLIIYSVIISETKRRYIGTGIITVFILIPLLLFGACFVLLGNS